MKYSVGQKVKIRSLEWYRDNVNRYGIIECGKYEFFEPMNEYCGKVVTIKRIDNDNYRIDTDKGAFCWTDEMIEGLAEEEDLIPKFGEYSDNEPLDVPTMTTEFVKEHGLPCPEGYIFKDENGNVINATKIVLEKKKKEYPKTYEECCKVLGCKANDFFTDFSYNCCDVETSDYEDKIDDLLQNFRKLIYCRDAYWKIAGEEMGLGKPWEPSESDYITGRYCIFVHQGNIICSTPAEDCPFTFPTEEMRAAFYENFKELIESVKELL